MTEQELMTNVVLNDSKKYIMNNIKCQMNSQKKGTHCSIMLLSGPPGIGKSDIMEQIARELKMGLNPQYLGTMLVEQFGMPLPTMEKDATFQKWSQPDFYSTANLRVKSPAMEPIRFEDGAAKITSVLESGDTIILFLDDIHLATKTIQTYFFQLLTYRSIHNKKMPKNFVMIAAGNRSIDRAGSQPIMAPIVNRFYMIDVIAKAEDWIDNFAIPNQLRHDIISFMGFYPSLLQNEPLESKAWASPRSWTYLSQEMTQMENDFGSLDIKDMSVMGKGHIGVDYTVKFIEYVKLFMKWDARRFLDGTPLPRIRDNGKIDNYTLMSAVVGELLKDARRTNWDMTDETMVKEVDIVKSLFEDMIEVCPMIVPLGLRSLILSDKDVNQTAKMYAQLTSSERLIGVMKEILGQK